jgi:hypothetical protein
MAPPRFALGLVAIAAFALVLRGVYIVAVTRNRTISFDEFYYEGEARSIADGNGFDLPRAGTLALGAGAHRP